MLPHSEVWKNFENFVIKRWGKKHTVMGLELENALKLYMAQNLKTHTRSKTQIKLDRYKNYLKSKDVDTAAYIHENAVKDMMYQFSKEEKRTIDRYFSILIEESFFKGNIERNPPKKSKKKPKTHYF
jgi:hypothetical protein